MGPTTGMILIRHGQTEFNRVYSETRRDPGIRDPQLTAVGRSQAATVAQALGAMNPSRLIASPYTRALETAEIIAAELGLPISVEPLALLQARWPDIAFEVPNGAALRTDPTRSDRRAEPLFLPGPG
jgi:broad specificity phosphatase PhoE